MISLDFDTTNIILLRMEKQGSTTFINNTEHIAVSVRTWPRLQSP